MTPCHRTCVSRSFEVTSPLFWDLAPRRSVMITDVSGPPIGAISKNQAVHPEIPERRRQVTTECKPEISHLKGPFTSTTPPRQTGSPFLPIVYQSHQHIQIQSVYRVWNSSGSAETTRTSCVLVSAMTGTVSHLGRHKSSKTNTVYEDTCKHTLRH